MREIRDINKSIEDARKIDAITDHAVSSTRNVNHGDGFVVGDLESFLELNKIQVECSIEYCVYIRNKHIKDMEARFVDEQYIRLTTIEDQLIPVDMRIDEIVVGLDTGHTIHINNKSNCIKFIKCMDAAISLINIGISENIVDDLNINYDTKQKWINVRDRFYNSLLINVNRTELDKELGIEPIDDTKLNIRLMEELFSQGE